MEIVPTLVSTNAVQKKDRLSYWCDLICDVFVHLESKPLGVPSFFGTISTNHLASIQFSEVYSTSQHVIRSYRQIAKSTEEYFLVSFQLSGEGVVKQNGRIANLSRGDWAIYDSTQPYELLFKDRFKQMVLQIPKRLLISRLPLLEDMTALTIAGNTGLGKVTTDFIQSTNQQIALIPSPLSAQLASTTIDLLVTSLNESCLNSERTSRCRTIKTIEIKSFVREQLSNPKLSAEMIADASNYSRTYLYSLFQKEELTISQYIKNLRLEKCRQELSLDLPNLRSITEIAFSWGFNDSAHFSRSFKKKFGFSPRAYRNKQLNSDSSSGAKL